ncbi:MAG: diguanylate cyclase [Myxococcaceae bacterium]
MTLKLDSIGKKLFWAVGLPALLVALAGVGLLWEWTADAVRGQAANEGAALAQVREVFQTALIALIGFGGVIALAVGVALHFMLARPLGKLSGTMRSAEEGNFLVRAPVNSADEIGSLGQAFNQMLARITSLEADEIDTHRDLEAAHEQIALKKQLEITNAKLETRVTELALLYDVARSMTSTLELPEVLKAISDLVTERLKLPQFSVMMLNAKQELEVKTAIPSLEGTEGLTFKLNEGACGIAAATLRHVYIPDLALDNNRVYTNRGSRARTRGALLAVPMTYQESLLGVLNFERPEPASFSPEDIELLCAVADLSAAAVKNARLHEETVALAITDALTGIPNRRHLFTQLELEVARANRFGNQVSILMVDIDHFKMLNDHSGHRAGDDVLREVSVLMGTQVRKVDTLARYGGEEFMLVLPQVSKAEAADVAEKLRKAVENAPIAHSEHQPLGKVTISVGVANLPVDAVALEKLVDCADSSLYASKRAGRNKVTPYAAGMELHPGRERGPHVRRKTGEIPAAVAAGEKP